jgi:hypothetical protein
MPMWSWILSISISNAHTLEVCKSDPISEQKKFISDW